MKMLKEAIINEIWFTRALTSRKIKQHICIYMSACACVYKNMHNCICICARTHMCAHTCARVLVIDTVGQVASCRFSSMSINSFKFVAVI
jgi:hypothetical protein